MAVALSPASFIDKPIKFGTDGWRGLIAADFTFGRVARVASAAAQVLKQEFADTGSNTVIVGYDRRFLSPEFAQVAAEAIAALGFDVMLSASYAPTPAFSWAAKANNALGAIVITASHNPAAYSGLKIKGAFGGSVSPDVTQLVEARLGQPESAAETPGQVTPFDPWPSYCEGIRAQVDIEAIRAAVRHGQLTVFADVMHGSAASGVERILGLPIHELNGEADPLFGGGAPEPLPKYLGDSLATIKPMNPKPQGAKLWASCLTATAIASQPSMVPATSSALKS